MTDYPDWPTAREEFDREFDRIRSDMASMLRYVESHPDIEEVDGVPREEFIAKVREALLHLAGTGTSNPEEDDR